MRPMSADFALSLSFDGIALLHRGDSGWTLLGQADVGSATLEEDLAGLRALAEAIAPEGFGTRLVIPHDQIKFLTLPTPDASADDVAAALDGATPYPLEALVIDFTARGGQTHVAAVARKTLLEAEAFAQGHGFHPVAFVAVPPDGDAQEIFFGDSRLAGDRKVTRGPAPVVQEAAVEPSAPAEPLAEESVAVRPVLSSCRIDPVIAEYHQRRSAAPAKKVKAAAPAAKPALVAPVSLQPTKSASPPPVAAPLRQPQVAPAAALPFGRIAAGVAAVIVAGGVAWAMLGGEDAPAISDIPPVAATEVLAGLTPTAEGTAPDASLVASAPPAPTASPEALPAATADYLPLPVQLPPAPPTGETFAENGDAARVAVGQILTPDEARAFYDATGVWLRAARFYDVPSGAIPLGFTPPQTTESYAPVGSTPLLNPVPVADAAFGTPAVPPPPDAVFAQDDDGFVQATPEGAVTPEGVVVFAGLPQINYAPRPDLSEAELAVLAPAPDGIVVNPATPAVLPAKRPDDLVPGDPATVDAPEAGAALAQLELQDSGTLSVDSAVVEAARPDDPRPQLRPNGLATVTADTAPDITDVLAGVVAEDAALRFDNSTALAVAASRRPALRPDTVQQFAANALAQRAAETLAAAAAANAPPPPPAPTPAAAPAPPPEPEAADEPDIEVASAPLPQPGTALPGGVARAATQEDAIALRQINLIGVYGRPNSRRALVRLANGRYQSVEIGSELDGGQVTAIGDDALNYVKRGRTYAIVLP